MRLEECINRITKYFSSHDNHPRIVNVNNIEDLAKFKEHFNVGGNHFLTVKDYSKKDENPSIDMLINDLNIKRGKLFLTEFTSFMKLKGEDELNQFLKQLLHSSYSNIKLIILCYQCEQYLKVYDRRFKTFIYLINGYYTPIPKLIFIKNKDLLPNGAVVTYGIDNVVTIIESENVEDIYVKTDKVKNNYKRSLYTIVEQSSTFDLLRNNYSMSRVLDESMGNDNEWTYALNEILKHESWNGLIASTFGTCENLEFAASNWKYFEDNKKWLYFIALKLYGAKNDWCLNKAAKETKCKDMLMRNIYRNILDEDCRDNEFWSKYHNRKVLINSFGDDIKEVNDYCHMVKCKGEDTLYYITDNTKQEKELIFEMLDKYGKTENYDEILEVLRHVYNDLYSYLSPYRFGNDLLDTYFQDYKYQKVANKIFPDFKRIVEEQAQRRDYNLLPPRTSKIEDIDTENSALYFVDAMGVEFLSFIMEKCKKHNLMAYSINCRCELPSLTEYNKEFIDVFEGAGALLVSGRKGIKDIDKVKHEGVDGTDYNSTKLPIHLIKELEIIENIIKNIDKNLNQGSYKKAIIISDHGTSRLAVINENENKWEMATKGKHSGRCCPVNEIDEQPTFATEENDFWVLANYDRFKGGRKSDVEVHGGASLEEVLVPIIEITRKTTDIEISILTPKIKFNIREKNAQIKLFSKTKVSDVTVEVNKKIYNTETEDDQTFIVKMPDLSKVGTYNAKVYSDNNLLKDDLKFIAEKEGFTTKKLF